MIQSIQKVIKIGSSAGVTIPAKTLKMENVSIGDEVEITIRHIKKVDEDTIAASRRIIEKYKTDFKNLSQR